MMRRRFFTPAMYKRERSHRILNIFKCWGAGLYFGLCSMVVSAQPPEAIDFQRVVVADGLNLPLEFEISKDGRIFIVSKCGEFYGWNIDQTPVTSPRTMVPNVRCVFEDGLLSIALDPNFTSNNWVYLQYMVNGERTRVARFTVNPDFTLDLNSYTLIIEWYSRESSGHAGGSMLFDKSGNLLISTGDNNGATGYYSSGGQVTSGNTNDLRGKVLRIRPLAQGGYTIPAGNLFQSDGQHRAEIYAMGFRNPFRMNIDSLNGDIYVGDVGPDASADSAEGPGGLDEINLIRQAGNYGWPWILGFNQPYAGFDPNNLRNNHPDNTGAVQIPNAVPAIWTVRHRATMAGPVYRYDPSIQNDFRLPPYYDGHLIFWDFNSSKMFNFPVDNLQVPAVEEEMPLRTGGIQGVIDVEFDPRTQDLYVMQWGSGCCDKEPFNNGTLYRFEYIGDRQSGNNLARNGTATASTELGNNLAMHAIDGDLSTRWESAFSDPQSITIDLQSEYTLSSIVLTWENAYSSAYRIEGSRDGNGWTMINNETNGSGSVELIQVQTSEAFRFIRLTGTQRGTAYGHSLFEIEIYGDEGGGEPDPLTEHAYLNMPRTLDANFTDVPRLLSQTGAFDNAATLDVADHMIPYVPNAKLWSDRAAKNRWLSLPADTQIAWSEQGQWGFPEGTVAVKHFELPVDEGNPMLTRRLETRLLVMQANGQVYGVTYKWRADNSDADLLTTSVLEDISVRDSFGGTWTQTWAYPSPGECIDCHNAQSNQYLGLNTRQLNADINYPGHGTENQLAHFNHNNLFLPAFNNAAIASFDKLADIGDSSASVEHRVKSYLDANCAHCHGTGNGGSQWDARYNTDLAQMGMIDEPTTGIRNYFDYYGISDAKVISTSHPEESILYIRDRSTDPDDRMPPIGRALEDEQYIAVLEQWLNSLAGGPGNTPTPTPTPSPTVPPVPGEPLACTATASSQESAALSADKVCDGDANTRWSSEFSDPQTLTLDLADVYALDRIELVWEAAYGSAYRIDVSVDGANWQAFASETNSDGGTDVVRSSQVLSARYIRLTGTVRATQWGYSLFTVDVYGSEDLPPTPVPTPTPDLVNPISCSATASTVENAATPASNVCDTDPASRWSSEFADPQWVRVDLQSLHYIARVALEWETAYATQYQIQVSNDGANWTSVHTESASDGGADVVDITDATGRYVRVYGTARATQWGYSLYSVKVYGASADGPVPTATPSPTPTATPTPTPTVTLSIQQPSSGQQFTFGDAVSLQVVVSSNSWFSSGGTYRYSLNNGSAVTVNNASPVNLGALAVGSYQVSAQLYNNQGQAVGNVQAVGFSVVGGSTPTDPVPAPAKIAVQGVQVSSFLGARDGSRAVDGDPSTRWESEFADPQFIVLDLGSEHYLTEFSALWEAAYARAYSLDISTNGSSWTTVYSTSNGNGGEDVIPLNGETARYVRVYGTQRATGYGYSIFEMSVSGIPANPNFARLQVASPQSGGQYGESDSVQLNMSVSDPNWFAQGGRVQYQLDANSAQLASNANAISLGVLPTGQHVLKLTLINSAGQAVGVPRTIPFAVTCGNNCPKVLVFSKTSGFRHGSIEPGIAMIEQLGQSYGYSVTATEDANVFTTTNLAQYSTIVFMNTTGDIFNTQQENAFRSYMENGGGYVGTHSAADTEHNWDWYTNTLLAGAEFIHHGDGIPRAHVVIEQPNDALVNHIAADWFLADEWYFFESNPRFYPDVEVLATLDRSSYNSNYPVEDHPIVFKNYVGQGKVFYTAIGHVDANFSEEEVVEMLRKAIEWTSQ